LVLFIVASLTFFMLFVTADPVAVQFAGVTADQEQIAAVKHSLGYDQPLVLQYIHFLGRIARGDFGLSAQYGQPCLRLILNRAPYTLVLDLVAIAVALTMAVPLGLISAVKRGSAVDRMCMFLAGVGQSIPSFVWGPILILVFAVALRMVPVAGASSPQAIVLPAITLALEPMARIARLLRSSVLDVMTEQYVVTARAKGLAPFVVLGKHVLRNALLPMLTLLGLQIAALMGGTIVVETVFGWPGLGYFAAQALYSADFPLVQTIIIFITGAVVLINLATDIAYVLADPRISYS
jgi:peptide/nickel transport system permease protein